MIGGELLTGMTINGAINGRGEWIIGGVVDDLLAAYREIDGFMAPLNAGADPEWPTTRKL